MFTSVRYNGRWALAWGFTWIY